MHTPHGTLAQLELSGDTSNLGMAVLGSSGNGKTFLTQNIVAAFAGNADITVVDQKRDYQTLVNLLGGSTVALEPGGASVNIFDLPEGEHEPDDAHRLHPLAVSQELEDLEAVRGILNNISLYFLGQLSRGQVQGVCSLIGLDSSLFDTVSHLARGQYLTVRRTAVGALEGEVLELLSSRLHYQTFTSTPQEVTAREARLAQ